MKKIYVCLLMCILCISGVWAQNSYVKGYYINNEGETVHGFIIHKDYEYWQNSPNELKFKVSETSEVEILNTSEVAEFGAIDKQFRFIRAEVDIDYSSDVLENYSHQRQPEFRKEIIFLRVLVSGDISLLEFRTSEIVRYFYSIKETGELEQLVYKKFYVNRKINGTNSYEEKIGINEYYRQQLKTLNFCSSVTDDELKHLRYYRKSLLKLFKKYNTCNGTSFEVYELEKPDKNWAMFGLNFRLGVGIASLDVENSNRDQSTQFYQGHSDNEISWQASVEIEYMLPFNNNKWSIILEPTFNDFGKVTAENYSYSNIFRMTHELEYSTIEIPIGIRYYFYLSDQCSIYLNGSYNVMNFDINNQYSRVFYGMASGVTISSDVYELETINNLRLGVGCRYRNFSAEVRHNFSKNFDFKEVNNLDVGLQSTALILGYKFF